MIRTKGTKVKVYRNLNNGLLSVMDFNTKKVIGHADEIALCDVEFQINTKARDKVRNEGRKNVHAFIVGNITALGKYTQYKGRAMPEVISNRKARESLPDMTHALYDPYKYDHFVCAHTKEPIHSAEGVYIDDGGFIAVEL